MTLNVNSPEYFLKSVINAHDTCHAMHMTGSCHCYAPTLKYKCVFNFFNYRAIPHKIVMSMQHNAKVYYDVNDDYIKFEDSLFLTIEQIL